MAKIKPVATKKAPGAVGPYSQAIRAGGFVFCSGQIPLDPESGEMVGDDVQAQTRQVLKNLAAVLKKAGSGLDRVVKTTVLLTTMDDFVPMNEVYAEVFGDHRPARAAFAAVGLPKGALVEIEAIALED
jgi:2-iminobutanoate/2-iminopropanoate deaminase